MGDTDQDQWSINNNWFARNSKGKKTRGAKTWRKCMMKVHFERLRFFFLLQVWIWQLWWRKCPLFHLQECETATMSKKRNSSRFCTNMMKGCVLILFLFNTITAKPVENKDKKNNISETSDVVCTYYSIFKQNFWQKCW